MSTDDGAAAAGRAPWSRRRHRRQTLTFVAVVLLVLAAAGYAGAYFEGLVGSSPPRAAPVCPRQARPALRPEQVRVAVYNATRRRGIARSVATSLSQRGFVVSAVGNEPGSHHVEGPGEVRYGARGARAARLVAAQLRGARLVRVGRGDAGVSLVLGSRYRSLAPARTARAPSPTTSPVGCRPPPAGSATRTR